MTYDAPDTAGTVGILTGFPRTFVCLIPAYWPKGHERMVDLYKKQFYNFNQIDTIHLLAVTTSIELSLIA